MQTIYLTIDDVTKEYRNPLTLRGLDIIKLKNANKVDNVYMFPCAFDIETSHLKESEYSYMYIWQFGFIKDEQQYVVIGRTWEEFHRLVEIINKKLGTKQKLLCLVHNLTYEFYFLLGEFKKEIKNLFCKDEHTIIKFDIGNIEFRDSYILTNSSLSKLAQDYTTTQKLVGELDYDFFRTHKTEMQKDELQYCINDVVILCEFWQYMIKHFYNENTQILPLTQTGLVREDVKAEMTKEIKDRYNMDDDVKAFKRLCRITKSLYPSEQLYKFMMKYCFKGGYTHSIIDIVGELLTGLDSYDLTSAYPSVICQPRYRYPRKFHAYHNYVSRETFLELSKNYCVMAIIKFKNLKVKEHHITYISKSKCIELENEILDNGKIFFASTCTTMETEIDFDCIDKCYNFDEVEFVKVWIAEPMPMPKGIIKTIMKNYYFKNYNKKHKIPYMNEKIKVNCSYGLLVQKLIEKQVQLVDGVFSIKDSQTYEKQIEKKFLLPQWGMYVTAYVRNIIINTLVKNSSAGVNVYSDTDSIKGKFSKECLDYMKHYNELCVADNHKIADELGIDFDMINDLGCFDCETINGQYTRFKTLGSKRYLYVQNSELHQTIAGLSKTYFNKKFGNNFEKAFEFFNDKMYVEDTEKMRTVVHYADDVEEKSKIVYDGIEMKTKSCITLLPVDYTLTINKLWMVLIKATKEKEKYLEKR